MTNMSMHFAHKSHYTIAHAIKQKYTHIAIQILKPKTPKILDYQTYTQVHVHTPIKTPY